MEQAVVESPANISKRLLKSFKRPKSVTFQKVDDQDNYAQFVAEPFEKGFGVTVGNCMRRALLSSIEGTGIVAIKIEGVQHEYSVIEGVQEDVSKIILNLKKLRFVYEGSNPISLEIEKSGAGFLTGADFEVNSGVQILNKDCIVASLNKDANIRMTVQLDKGKGYLSVEETKKFISELGVIPLDTLFSPIKKVNITITDTVVDQKFDYDKLILDVWTNGVISPEDAVACAAKIIKDYFTIFINFEEDIVMETDQLDESEEKIKEILSKSVENLEFSVRTLAVLKSLDIKNLGDIVSRYEEELTKSKHYSDKVLLQVKSILSEHSLSFGMKNISL